MKAAVINSFIIDFAKTEANSVGLVLSLHFKALDYLFLKILHGQMVVVICLFGSSLSLETRNSNWPIFIKNGKYLNLSFEKQAKLILITWTESKPSLLWFDIGGYCYWFWILSLSLELVWASLSFISSPSSSLSWYSSSWLLIF